MSACKTCDHSFHAYPFLVNCLQIIDEKRKGRAICNLGLLYNKNVCYKNADSGYTLSLEVFSTALNAETTGLAIKKRS